MAGPVYEILIIGAGIFGTSTAYHLSKTHPNPSSIAVIDRTPFPPNHAASTDINKIIRPDYASRFYMDLAYEAIEAWDTWPELKGKGYYHRTGWLNLSNKGSDLADRIRQNFRERGEDPTTDVALDTVRTMCGGIFAETNLDDFEKAYWNPLAGWCDAAAATAELMRVAVDRGVKYITGNAQSLNFGAHGVEGVLLANGDLITAKKIVLASGAWTSSILTTIEDKLEIREEDCIENQITAAAVCVAHYKLADEEVEQLHNMPVVIYGESGDCQPPPSNNLLKLTWAPSIANFVTTSSGRRITVPPDRDQRIVPERLKEETRSAISHQVLPQYTQNRSEAYWRLCWDAVSPSQDHLITRHPHPRLNNLFLAVGGSFHSYKFLPTIGKYVVNVLEGRSNGHEKDEHWAWKTNLEELAGSRGAHEKASPKMELREMEESLLTEKAKL